MNLNLEGRIALVTGGGRGIGEAIAFALTREGATGIICGRHLEPLIVVKRKIESAGGKVFAYITDATDVIGIRMLLRKIRMDFGRLDILVNNVGGAEKFGGFFDLTEDDWVNAYKLNFMSMVYFTREAAPLLRESNNARIINISSLSGIRPGMFNPHYGAAKAAMLNLSKHLANLMAKDGILVNAICPSTLKGGGWDKNVLDRANRSRISPKEAENLMEEEERTKNPLGKIGTLDDVADLVTFLASDRAKFITGSCFRVDGGIVTSIV